MKRICKVKIHPLLILIMFICIITGLFKELCIFMLIILLHELGHIIVGLLFKQKIEKVILLPFGGITIFNMKLNIPCYQEFLIATAGPLAQIISYICLKDIINNNLFYYYNVAILLFNLIPIYPLDGSKIINVCLNKIMCFRNCFFISFFISFILIIVSIILIMMMHFNYLFILFFILLFYKNYMEFINYNYIFNKFLWERYSEKIVFKKMKYISNIKNMYKDKRHLIKNGEKWCTEREILQKRFDFKKNIC